MKLRFLFLLMISSLLFAASCGGDDEDATTTFTATIDGEVYTANIATATTINVPGEGDVVNVTGSAGGGNVLTLSISIPENESIGTTTYTFADDNCGLNTSETCIWFSFSDSGQTFPLNTVSGDLGGSLTITFEEANTASGGKIKGTFNGVVVNDFDETTKPLTNGSFNVEVR